jgi:hypothetical protein
MVPATQKSVAQGQCEYGAGQLAHWVWQRLSPLWQATQPNVPLLQALLLPPAAALSAMEVSVSRFSCSFLVTFFMTSY